MFVRRRRSNLKMKLGWTVVFISSFILIGFTGKLIGMNLVSQYVWPDATIIVHLSDIHQNISFNYDTVYFYNGTTYDFYSLNELNNSTSPWKKFPLSNDSRAYRRTGLAFVDQIFIATTLNLTDRQENLKQLFRREQIDQYEWRLKWKQKECLNDQNRKEVIRKMNLRLPLMENKIRLQQCAITMEHVDIWFDIVQRNLSLALILEDDAIFVRSFAEKLNRTIFEMIHRGALKIGDLSQCLRNRQEISAMKSNEWIEQDPIIMIGTCMNLFDKQFPKRNPNASPQLSTHKKDASRCTHAYLLTACSAQALLDQIKRRNSYFLQSDLLLIELVAESPTLQSFWLDPPIVYQGNRVYDLDGIPSFRYTSYRVN